MTVTKLKHSECRTKHQLDFVSSWLKGGDGGSEDNNLCFGIIGSLCDKMLEFSCEGNEGVMGVWREDFLGDSPCLVFIQQMYSILFLTRLQTM